MRPAPTPAPLIVAGAGLAGLSCAYHADGPVVVVDREPQPGGTARSFEIGGFTFDFTGHLLHLHHPYTTALVKRLLKGNWVVCRRDARIHSHGVLSAYPFQANLAALPPRVIRECVEGVRRSRARWGDRPLEGAGRLTFRQWCDRLFGAGISKHFMVPYNEKLWRIGVDDLTPEWCGNFVPVPTLAEVEAGARTAHRKAFGYNTTFLYPRTGGIQVLSDALAREVRGLRLGAALESVDWEKRRVLLSTGEWQPYRRLVSTLPLPELLKRLTPFPAELEEPRSRLRWTTVLCVNLGVARPKISPASWIYFPEKKYPFYRVGFPMNFTPHVVPRGCSSMYVEIACDPGREPAGPGARERLLSRVREGLIAAKILKRSDQIPVAHVVPIRYAYVVYDRHRTEALDRIFRWLDRRAGADSIGRYGAWKYSFMEEALLDGKRVAESDARRRRSPAA
ncbi:MAG: FAD-dependent oxidoreductase [Elusimicrobia bacterium]|nr:FAD-dependent oxidoreductase [Elusimicrobiota bacterium]